MDNIREYIVDQVLQNHLDKKQGARYLQELDDRSASIVKDIAVIGMAGRFPKAESLLHSGICWLTGRIASVHIQWTGSDMSTHM